MNYTILQTLAFAAVFSGATALGSVAAQDSRPVPATPLKPAPPAPQKFDQEKMKAEHEKKLAKEVFKKAPWTFDYDKAREEAKKSGKPIFAYFSRSYSP